MMKNIKLNIKQGTKFYLKCSNNSYAKNIKVISRLEKLKGFLSNSQKKLEEQSKFHFHTA